MSSKRTKVRESGILRALVLVMGLLFLSVSIWGVLIWIAVLGLPNLGINPVVEEGLFTAYAVLLAVFVLIISFGLYSWLLGKRLNVHVKGGG
jgi:uncharacterized metal-binding protein